MASKALLVPTAEEDSAVHLSIFRDFFTLPAGILFLTPEERELVGKVALGALPPSAVIGFAVDVPEKLDPAAFKAKRGLARPYLHVGRIDRNKGCDGLFRVLPGRHQAQYRRRGLGPGRLVALPIPDHPRIKYEDS